MVFGHECVLAVCEHKNPTIMKVHPLLIFESPLNQVSLIRPAVLILTAVLRHISEGRATEVDWQPCLVIVSALSDYTVLHFLRPRAAVTLSMSRKQSRCSVFACKFEHWDYESLNFLSTSELLRMLWITFFFQGNSPQDLPKYVYHSRIICECHIVIVLIVLTIFVCVH